MKGIIAAAVMGIAGLALARQGSDQNLYQRSMAFEIQGTVSKKSGNSVTIARPNLPAADLKLSDQTEITLNGQKVNANALSEGTPVRARFQLSGDQPVAVSIDAQPSGSFQPGR